MHKIHYIESMTVPGHRDTTHTLSDGLLWEEAGTIHAYFLSDLKSYGNTDAAIRSWDFHAWKDYHSGVALHPNFCLRYICSECPNTRKPDDYLCETCRKSHDLR